MWRRYSQNRKRPISGRRCQRHSGSALARPATLRLGVEVLEDRWMLSLEVVAAHVVLPASSLQPLIPYRSVWRYLDDGMSPPATWREHSFDDSQWKTGFEPLGYGRSPDIARWLSGRPVDCGPSAPLCTSGNRATTYFRHEFAVEHADEVEELHALLWRDRGAAVYLNGGEVYRDAGLPPHADSQAYAAGRVGEETVAFAMSPGLLRDGDNVLAVEVHLGSPQDPEMIFALDLLAVARVESQAPARLEVQLNGNVDPASVEPADLRINGTGATGVSVADPQTLVFDLPPLSPSAAFVATLAAGALLGEGGAAPSESYALLSQPGAEPQYRVVHTPRLQLGDAPLAPFPGSATDQVDVLWQTVPIGPGTSDRFTVDYRLAGSARAWLPATAHAPIDTGVGQRVIHSAAITGLRYDTDYEYRVRHWRAGMVINAYQHVFHTRLPAGSDAPFTFAAYGDSAENWRVQNFRAVQRQINDSPAAFALTLGDNIYPAGLHQESDARFDPLLNPEAGGWIASHIDYAAIGNHEIMASDGRPYREYFSSPLPVAHVNAPAQPPAGEPPEHSYSFDYGNVHFVTFDTNSLYNAQRLDGLLDWVEADLAASRATWKIVFGHHSLAFVPDKPESPADNFYQQVVSRLRSADVDLYLVGHSHTFSWTKPLLGQTGGVATFVNDPDKVYAKGAGLVQLVNGAGGRTLRPGSYSGPGDEAVAAGFTTDTDPRLEFGYAQLDVSPTELKVSYVSACDGRVIDGFRITSGAVRRADVPAGRPRLPGNSRHHVATKHPVH